MVRTDDMTTIASSAGSRLRLDHLDPAEIEAFRKAGTIIADPRRRRPRYFDGRFLAAPDLTREQDYFIARQADLTRAGGAGVLHGLGVTRVDDTRVKLARGNGITPAGDLVVLTDDLTVDLADVAEMQRLDRVFALDTIPNEPPRRRTGLFVLALRPIEFTANPIAAYPASVAERRAVDDGEIIEGVALTLIPYRDDHTELDPQQQRGYVARRIFVEKAATGTPAEALPVAVVQMDRGFILWIDPWLTRREIGAEHAGVAGFGLTPRSVREAHVQQYNGQLAELLAERAARGSDGRFPASQVFRALPPAGQLPAESVEYVFHSRGDFVRPILLDFRQLYFPPQLRATMAVVPLDEIAALVEEALLLPPIDLAAPTSELDFTSVTVLVGIERGAFDQARRDLARMLSILHVGDPAEVVAEMRRLFNLPLQPSAPGIVARRQPTDVFSRLLPAMPSSTLRATGPLDLERPRVPFDRVAVTPAGGLRPTLPRTEIGREFAIPIRAIGPISEGPDHPPPLPEDYELAADNFLGQALADASSQSARLWYVRSRTQHVAPDAVPLHDPRSSVG
jgi:hypothetical protein